AGKRPWTLSKRRRCAFVSTGPRSLIATTSMSRRPLSTIARSTFRPIRPNPLIATLTVIAILPCGLQFSLALTPENRCDVNGRIAASTPEGEPFDEIGELAGKEERRAEVQPQRIDDDKHRDQDGEGERDPGAHGRGRGRPPGLLLQEPPHRTGHVGHPAGEAPFVVVPGDHAIRALAHHLGLVGREDRGI